MSATEGPRSRRRPPGAKRKRNEASATTPIADPSTMDVELGSEDQPFDTNSPFGSPTKLVKYDESPDPNRSSRSILFATPIGTYQFEYTPNRATQLLSSVATKYNDWKLSETEAGRSKKLPPLPSQTGKDVAEKKYTVQDLSNPIGEGEVNWNKVQKLFTDPFKFRFGSFDLPLFSLQRDRLFDSALKMSNGNNGNQFADMIASLKELFSLRFEKQVVRFIGGNANSSFVDLLAPDTVAYEWVPLLYLLIYRVFPLLKVWCGGMTSQDPGHSVDQDESTNQKTDPKGSLSTGRNMSTWIDSMIDGLIELAVGLAIPPLPSPGESQQPHRQRPVYNFQRDQQTQMDCAVLEVEYEKYKLDGQINTQVSTQMRARLKGNELRYFERSLLIESIVESSLQGPPLQRRCIFKMYCLVELLASVWDCLHLALTSLLNSQFVHSLYDGEANIDISTSEKLAKEKEIMRTQTNWLAQFGCTRQLPAIHPLSVYEIRLPQCMVSSPDTTNDNPSGALCLVLHPGLQTQGTDPPTQTLLLSAIAPAKQVRSSAKYAFLELLRAVVQPLSAAEEQFAECSVSCLYQLRLPIVRILCRRVSMKQNIMFLKDKTAYTRLMNFEFNLKKCFEMPLCPDPPHFDYQAHLVAQEKRNAQEERRKTIVFMNIPEVDGEDAATDLMEVDTPPFPGTSAKTKGTGGSGGGGGDGSDGSVEPEDATTPAAAATTAPVPTGDGGRARETYIAQRQRKLKGLNRRADSVQQQGSNEHIRYRKIPTDGDTFPDDITELRKADPTGANQNMHPMTLQEITTASTKVWTDLTLVKSSIRDAVSYGHGRYDEEFIKTLGTAISDAKKGNSNEGVETGAEAPELIFPLHLMRFILLSRRVVAIACHFVKHYAETALKKGGKDTIINTLDDQQIGEVAVIADAIISRLKSTLDYARSDNSSANLSKTLQRYEGYERMTWVNYGLHPGRDEESTSAASVTMASEHLVGLVYDAGETLHAQRTGNPTVKTKVERDIQLEISNNLASAKFTLANIVMCVEKTFHLMCLLPHMSAVAIRTPGNTGQITDEDRENPHIRFTHLKTQLFGSADWYGTEGGATTIWEDIYDKAKQAKGNPEALFQGMFQKLRDWGAAPETLMAEWEKAGAPPIAKNSPDMDVAYKSILSRLPSMLVSLLHGAFDGTMGNSFYIESYNSSVAEREKNDNLLKMQKKPPPLPKFVPDPNEVRLLENINSFNALNKEFESRYFEVRALYEYDPTGFSFNPANSGQLTMKRSGTESILGDPVAKRLDTRLKSLVVNYGERNILMAHLLLYQGSNGGLPILGTTDSSNMIHVSPSLSFFSRLRTQASIATMLPAVVQMGIVNLVPEITRLNMGHTAPEAITLFAHSVAVATGLVKSEKNITMLLRAANNSQTNREGKTLANFQNFVAKADSYTGNDKEKDKPFLNFFKSSKLTKEFTDRAVAVRGAGATLTNEENKELVAATHARVREFLDQEAPSIDYETTKAYVTAFTEMSCIRTILKVDSKSGEITSTPNALLAFRADKDYQLTLTCSTKVDIDQLQGDVWTQQVSKYSARSFEGVAYGTANVAYIGVLTWQLGTAVSDIYATYRALLRSRRVIDKADMDQAERNRQNSPRALLSGLELKTDAQVESAAESYRLVANRIEESALRELCWDAAALTFGASSAVLSIARVASTVAAFGLALPLASFLPGLPGMIGTWVNSSSRSWTESAFKLITNALVGRSLVAPTANNDIVPRLPAEYPERRLSGFTSNLSWFLSGPAAILIGGGGIWAALNCIIPLVSYLPDVASYGLNSLSPSLFPYATKVVGGVETPLSYVGFSNTALVSWFGNIFKEKLGDVPVVGAAFDESTSGRAYTSGALTAGVRMLFNFAKLWIARGLDSWDLSPPMRTLLIALCGLLDGLSFGLRIYDLYFKLKPVIMMALFASPPIAVAILTILAAIFVLGIAFPSLPSAIINKFLVAVGWKAPEVKQSESVIV